MTLAYSQVFHTGLSLEQLYLRQVATGEGEVLSRDQIIQCLSELVQKKLVVRKNGVYVPTQNGEWASQSQSIDDLLAAKKAEAQYVADRLIEIPFVQAVALTGSVAAGNVVPDDDCDFLIVTSPHTLWLSRLLVLLFAKSKHKRRSFANEEKNSWCFNMWLTSNSLIIPLKMRVLYTAYELCQAQWLASKNYTAQSFVAANGWAKNILPINYNFAYFKAEQKEKKDAKEYFAVYLLKALMQPVLVVTNIAAYLFQLVYMAPHRTKERVEYRRAFFHPRPTGGLVMKELKNRIEYMLYSKTEAKPKKSKPKVLVTGVFDLLHHKHREFLNIASQLGDLWVGVENDARVRQLKGEGRPVWSADKRLKMIKKLLRSEQVFILPDKMGETSCQIELLRQVQPDVLAVSDSTPNLAMKQKLMAGIGGRVEVIMEHDPRVSTTQIMQGKSTNK